MPANATHLACNYYFNTTSSSNTTQENSNSNKTGNINNLQPSPNKMELYKAKPQYLNTYNLSNSIQCATSSLASSLVNNTTRTTTPEDVNKNALSVDLQWSQIKKIGTGLYNLGNNCYLNATLQCMAYTPSLSQWLVNRPHTPICKLKPLKGFCSLCEVEKIIYDIFNSCNGCAKPNSLCFNIKKVSNVFGVGTQEDASEFFTTLLESMAKSMKFTLNPSQHGTSSNLNSNKLAFNILDEIFSFQFRSRITCCNCGRLSDTFENTNSWPVDVKYVTDIRKGMLHFLREEVLDGENSYKCDKCKIKVRATKKYSIQTAPNVLVINLKRFDFTYAGKLSHFVTYPETLSLKTFIGESEISTTVDTGSVSAEDSGQYTIRNVTYKLYGVLVHLGYTSHSGHYYSYVRGPNDVWYKADDQQISTVRLQDAMDQNAYILFYNRVPQSPPVVTLNSEAFLSPQPIPTYGPLSRPLIKQFTVTNKNETFNPEVGKILHNSPLVNRNIPENKFKSTFVAIQPQENTDTDTNTDTVLVDSNSNRTLNYDQVMKIKKLNKRKLKLLNTKTKLKELKRKKKVLKSEENNNNNNNEMLGRIKKLVKKLKKSSKKEKSKIKKLKKCETFIPGQSSSEESDCDELDEDLLLSLKRKHESDQDELEFDTKKFKKGPSNSLSLLKQYSSSASSCSDDEEKSSASRSSRLDSSRSSSSSSGSSSLSSSSPEIRNSSLAEIGPIKSGKLGEGEVDAKSSNEDSSQINGVSNQEESAVTTTRTDNQYYDQRNRRSESVSSIPLHNSNTKNNSSCNNHNKSWHSNHTKKKEYNQNKNWNNNNNKHYNNNNYRTNNNNNNTNYYNGTYKHKPSNWYNHRY